MKRSPYALVVLAWVLWIRTQGPTVDDWVATSGFASEQHCLANLKEKMDTWKQFKDATFAKNVVTFSGNNTTLTYLCLPDTEDPRRKPAQKGGR